MLQGKEPTCGASLVAEIVKIPHAAAKTCLAQTNK